MFHPSSTVAPTADEDDNDDSGEDDLEYLEDTPINPAAVQAVLSSAVASAVLGDPP